MKIITVTANPALDITAYVDNWTRGVVNRGNSVSVAAGGKGINVAINLAHSGLEVYATGWLGRDNDAVFRRSFVRERINDDFIRIEGETRRNIKIVDDSCDENTNLNMRGEKVTSADKKALEDYLEVAVDEWTILVFGGSLPPGISSSYYADMVKKFSGKCHLLAVDTDGEPLKEVLQGDWLPDLIKPNIKELREATGKALETDAEILEEAGEDGAWFVTKDKAVKAKPLAIDVVSVVGAGDAMLAGVIHDIVIGKSLEDIAVTATAYSAGNIEHIGMGLPSKARLETLKSQVNLDMVEF